MRPKLLDVAARERAERRPGSTRRQLSLETNSCRKGLWSTGPVQLEVPLDGEDLLGLIRSSGRLRVTPDLDVFAWLIDTWRRRPEEDGWVRFTLHELGMSLYEFDPGGKQNRAMRASLRRLRSVQVDLIGYDARLHRYGDRFATNDNLLDRIVSELDDVGPDARRIGALRGSTFNVQLPPWLRRQVEAGNVTYLDFRTLRSLDGLAKRLWVYLEAERMKPSGDGSAGCWIKLGDRAYTTLGMHYAQERQARAALKRAGAEIARVDERYSSVSVERRPGGWAVVARKISNREQASARKAIRTSLEESDAA